MRTPRRFGSTAEARAMPAGAARSDAQAMSARAAGAARDPSTNASAMAVANAERVEAALRAAVTRATASSCPPTLRLGIEHAVFPAGARLRPQLCLAVAASAAAATSSAESPAPPQGALHAAVALELVHCASLVHDDLPCFDGATVRRGRPSVHAAFGESTAVLVGDALIVMAFEVMALEQLALRNTSASVASGVSLISILARATGPAGGIIAGQAWENERAVSLDEYHRAKTASLFAAAAELGAVVAQKDARPWRRFGELLGRAYQAADDLVDARGNDAASGKPCGRDEALLRPSVVRACGIEAARERVLRHLNDATAALPPCPNPAAVLVWVNRFRSKVTSL